ncbi:MAG TPA: serine hydrolase domain-containing protein [Kribbella sp.]|nr:serine hydrolase domain-containing protein [Kribbella sp.]
MTDNLQKLVQESIDDLVESGAETGLQVAVYDQGELVVDAVAGLADPETGRAVTSDTPFYSASTGKGVTATVAHVLAERGLLDTTHRSSTCGPSSAPTARSPPHCDTC